MKHVHLYLHAAFFRAGQTDGQLRRCRNKTTDPIGFCVYLFDQKVSHGLDTEKAHENSVALLLAIVSIESIQSSDNRMSDQTTPYDTGERIKNQSPSMLQL